MKEPKDINEALARVLELIGTVVLEPAASPECLELCSLVKKLSELATYGVMPDQWQPGRPWTSAMIAYEAELAGMGAEAEDMATAACGRAADRGRFSVGILVACTGLTKRDAAAVIYAMVLDRIAESAA